MERKLAVILAADVVGYSTLMERDEEGTFQRLRTGRKELFEPEIARRHGRVFKLMGDGLMAEFGSVVDAVECAVSVQRGLAERNAAAPEEHRFRLRIGINLGEVIVEGDDRYGEGVNVAARLEQMAEPGGICVSGKVAREVERKLAFGFESMGEQQVRNIAEPIPVYRVLIDGAATVAIPGAPLALPARPSIAVLPFTNMSGDPEQDYFADGLVEDLITSLSKIPGLFVIARNSSFAYKGAAVDVRKVARELGVRYVLEGSVRRSAGRLRITGQLVEGEGATHVWADRFDGALEDVFDLQDRLAECIVGAIEPSIRKAEIERARRKRPDRLDAYDLFLQALPHVAANTPADSDRALSLLGESLRLDPGLAPAHAHASWCHEQRFLRAGFRPEDRDAALVHSEKAMTYGADDAQALAIAAFVHGNISHDYDGALAALDRALDLNANSALAYNFSAMASSFAGRFERSRTHAMRALRLSPFDPLNYHAHLALNSVNYFEGNLADAVAHATLALRANPGFTVLHAMLVASLFRNGEEEAAGKAAGRLLELAPGFTVGGFERMEVWRPHLMRELAEAMRQGGLPD